MIDLSKYETQCGGCDLYEWLTTVRRWGNGTCNVIEYQDKMDLVEYDCPCSTCLIKMMCGVSCQDKNDYTERLRIKVKR